MDETIGPDLGVKGGSPRRFLKTPLGKLLEPALCFGAALDIVMAKYQDPFLVVV